MPALVSHTVTTAALQLGDVTTSGTVADVDRKVKWATVTFESGASERVLLEDEWTVSRLEPTAEEKAASRLDARLRWLDRAQQAAAVTVAKARRDAIARLQRGELQDHWRLLDVAEAEEYEALWERFRRAAAYQGTRPEDEQLTLLEVLREVRAGVTERLVSSGPRRLSRSTSAVANLFEDMQADVAVAWLRDTSYADR